MMGISILLPTSFTWLREHSTGMSTRGTTNGAMKLHMEPPSKKTTVLSKTKNNKEQQTTKQHSIKSSYNLQNLHPSNPSSAQKKSKSPRAHRRPRTLNHSCLVPWHIRSKGPISGTSYNYSLKLTAKGPENRPGPKRKLIFQPSIFRCYSFKEGNW